MLPIFSVVYVYHNLNLTYKFFIDMLKRGFSLFRVNFTKNVSSSKGNVKMKAWQIHSYGDLSELQLSSSRLPVIKSPKEVLVKVTAASINPIDLLMLGGYGRTLLQTVRNFELEFPLTLGRDFSGTVISKGHDVGNEIKIGDEVYGSIPIFKQGTFAEYVIVTIDDVLPKPKHLSHVESASLAYATMTAWSALFQFGNLCRHAKGKRILIMGASGGVGCSAVQLLKSQDAEVFATCSTDAVPLVQSLGANQVFDYKDPDFIKQVEQEGRYHIILDAAKIGYQNIPKSWQYETFITLNSPLLLNTDKHGLVIGLARSAFNLFEANVINKKSGTVKWGFYLSNRKGFKFIDELIGSGKIKPVIHKTFKFENIPDGIKAVSNGHLRGKVAIDYS